MEPLFSAHDDTTPDEWIAASFRGTHYELLNVLGRGGMGVVYRARHVPTNTLCALKMMLAELSRDPQFDARLRLEAKTLSRLVHPNIVRMLHVGRTPDKRVFYTMELLEGMTLREMFRNKTKQGKRGRNLPLRRALAIELDLLAGLSVAHAAGVFHRDIKPHNVFVTTAGPAKIIDFGVAKTVFTVEGKDPTAAGMFLGTLLYVSPEILQGARATALCDVYSAGLVLFELLTGRPAFEQVDSMEQTMHEIIHRGVPRLDEVGFNGPRALVAIVERATRRAPALRYPSVDELAEDLRLVLASLPPDEDAVEEPSPPEEPSAEADRTEVDSDLPARVMAAVQGLGGGSAPEPTDDSEEDELGSTTLERSPFGSEVLAAEAEHREDERGEPSSESLSQTTAPSAPLAAQLAADAQRHHEPGSMAHSRTTAPNAELSAYLAEVDPVGATALSSIPPPLDESIESTGPIQRPSSAPEVGPEGTKLSALPPRFLLAALRADVGPPLVVLPGEPALLVMPAGVAVVEASERRLELERDDVPFDVVPSTLEPAFVVAGEALVLELDGVSSASVGSHAPERGSATKRSRLLLGEGASEAQGSELPVQGVEEPAVEAVAPLATAEATPSVDDVPAAPEPSWQSVEPSASSDPSWVQLASRRPLELEDDSTELRFQETWDQTATVRGPRRPASPSSSRRDAAFGQAALGLPGPRQSLIDYQERARQSMPDVRVTTSDDGVVHAVIGPAPDSPRATGAQVAARVEPAVHEQVVHANAVGIALPLQQAANANDATTRDDFSAADLEILGQFTRDNERLATEIKAKLSPTIWMLTGRERATAIRVAARELWGKVSLSASELQAERDATEASIRERLNARLGAHCRERDGEVRYLVLRDALLVRGGASSALGLPAEPGRDGSPSGPPAAPAASSAPPPPPLPPVAVPTSPTVAGQGPATAQAARVEALGAREALETKVSGAKPAKDGPGASAVKARPRKWDLAPRSWSRDGLAPWAASLPAYVFYPALTLVLCGVVALVFFVGRPKVAQPAVAVTGVSPPPSALAPTSASPLPSVAGPLPATSMERTNARDPRP